MDVFEAIFGRRSIRRYTGPPVPPEKLTKMLEAAVWAPSAGNIQPWEFVVVTDRAGIEQVKSVAPGMFGEPRLVVAVCANRQRAAEKAGAGGEILAMFDVAMAAQNLLLAAHALGLGACVIRSFHQAAVQKLLDCPDWVVPELLVAAGMPEGKAPKPSRRPLGEVVHAGGWGKRLQEGG